MHSADEKRPVIIFESGPQLEEGITVGPEATPATLKSCLPRTSSLHYYVAIPLDDSQNIAGAMASFPNAFILAAPDFSCAEKEAQIQVSIVVGPDNTRREMFAAKDTVAAVFGRLKLDRMTSHLLYGGRELKDSELLAQLNPKTPIRVSSSVDFVVSSEEKPASQLIQRTFRIVGIKQIVALEVEPTLKMSKAIELLYEKLPEISGKKVKILANKKFLPNLEMEIGEVDAGESKEFVCHVENFRPMKKQEDVKEEIKEEPKGVNCIIKIAKAKIEFKINLPQNTPLHALDKYIWEQEPKLQNSSFTYLIKMKKEDPQKTIGSFVDSKGNDVTILCTIKDTPKLQDAPQQPIQQGIPLSSPSPTIRCTFKFTRSDLTVPLDLPPKCTLKEVTPMLWKNYSDLNGHSLKYIFDSQNVPLETIVGDLKLTETSFIIATVADQDEIESIKEPDVPTKDPIPQVPMIKRRFKFAKEKKEISIEMPLDSKMSDVEAQILKMDSSLSGHILKFLQKGRIFEGDNLLSQTQDSFIAVVTKPGSSLPIVKTKESPKPLPTVTVPHNLENTASVPEIPTSKSVPETPVSVPDAPVTSIAEPQKIITKHFKYPPIKDDISIDLPEKATLNDVTFIIWEKIPDLKGKPLKYIVKLKTIPHTALFESLEDRFTIVSIDSNAKPPISSPDSSMKPSSLPVPAPPEKVLPNQIHRVFKFTDENIVELDLPPEMILSQVTKILWKHIAKYQDTEFTYFDSNKTFTGCEKVGEIGNEKSFIFVSPNTDEPPTQQDKEIPEISISTTVPAPPQPAQTITRTLKFFDDNKNKITVQLPADLMIENLEDFIHNNLHKYEDHSFTFIYQATKLMTGSLDSLTKDNSEITVRFIKQTKKAQLFMRGKSEFTLDLNPTSTWKEVKELVRKQSSISPIMSIGLTYERKELNDNELVSSVVLNPKTPIQVRVSSSSSNSPVPSGGSPALTQQIEISEEAISEIIGLGFEREQAIKALTKARGDKNTAANYLLTGESLEIQPQNSVMSPADALKSLEEMGFSQQDAQKALRQANGDVSVAASILMGDTNPEEQKTVSIEQLKNMILSHPNQLYDAMKSMQSNGQWEMSNPYPLLNILGITPEQINLESYNQRLISEGFPPLVPISQTKVGISPEFQTILQSFDDQGRKTVQKLVNQGFDPSLVIQYYEICHDENQTLELLQQE